MPGLWIDLLGCLDLHSAAQAGADERSDAEDITTFDGASQQLQYHRVFGGQLLGQFIRAAQLTCPDKTVKSLHAVFAREGRAAEPVRYPSTRQHQGRSFASLTITAHQTRGVLASSSVSMHAVEDGPEHQDREPVPALLGEKHRAELDLIPWETRCADDLNAVTAGPPRLELWMRTPPVDGDLAFALTAYASDLTPIGTALRPLEGFNHSGNGTLGGFNWSSQRLDFVEVSDGVWEAAVGGSRLSGADPVAGAADGGLAGGPGQVLGGDRCRGDDRGCRCRGRRVVTGRVSLVPSCWRRESTDARICFGPLPVLG